jgi:hypothetical protein
MCLALRPNRLFLTAILVLITWGYLCGLQVENDGLWFQVDSPRHALNGLFWKDFLEAHPSDPRAFAMSYFTRYPAVNPVSYPPFFYLLEAALFAVVGPSAFVAKGLVLGFNLVGTFYVLAWLRRWVGEGVGYAAAMVPLLPGIATWSQAIMLNVPACALCWGGLFHAKRWLEEPESRHLYWSAILSTLAVLTYYQSVIIVPIIVVWAVASGRVRVLISPRVLGVAAVCGVALLPCFLVAWKWAAAHAEMTTPAPAMLIRSSTWLFYPKFVPEQFGWALCILAALGTVAGLAGRRWRTETVLLLIWISLTYAFLLYLKAKDRRYLLPCAAPVLLLGSIGLSAIAGWLGLIAGHRLGKLTIPAAIGALLLTLGWGARSMPALSVRGIAEAANFVANVAPDEPVFYDGPLHGVFIFYVRAADADMRRMVVRGDKLLYSTPMSTPTRTQDHVFTTQEVTDSLRMRSGCRWLAIERTNEDELFFSRRLLREAASKPPFNLVATFPVTGTYITSAIDIYRIEAAVERLAEYKFYVPMLGAGEQFQSRPISGRRDAAGTAKRSITVADESDRHQP